MGAVPRSSVAVTVNPVDPAVEDAGSCPNSSAQAGWQGPAYQIVSILCSFLIGALAAGLLFQSVGRMTAMPRHHARLQQEEGQLRVAQAPQVQPTQQLAATQVQCSPAPPKQCPPSSTQSQPCLTPPVPPYVARHLAALQNASKPSLPEVARQQGIVSLGSGRRLQRFVSKLARGVPVSVMTVGGSVTAGAGATNTRMAYPTRFMAWLNATFPHPGNQLLNRGIGGSSAGLFALCLEIPAKPPDMVVLEFSFNEPENVPYDHPQRKGFEKLLRKVLRLPGRPLVVVLHHYAWWFTATKTDKGMAGGVYWAGAEAPLSLFAQYYDTPNLSLRAAAYHLMRRGIGNFKVDRLVQPKNSQAPQEPGKIGESFYNDYVHPTNFGHQALADILMELTWQGLTKLTQQAMAPAAQQNETSPAQPEQPGAGAAPANAAGAAKQAQQAEQQGVAARRRLVVVKAAPEEAKVEEEEEEEEEEGDIPPPMIPGNPDGPVSACFMKEAFQTVVVKASNFSWMPARPNATSFIAQKWAWTGTQPGAWGELTLDTRQDTTSNLTTPGTAAIKTTVILGYLRSYESMGNAEVECVSGCTCAPALLEGTWYRRATLMQMHEMTVTQHAHCRLRVTIRPETQSGAHKISLTSLMATAYPIRKADILASGGNPIAG